MFFIGIIGVDHKDKKLTDSAAPCPVCNDLEPKWVVKRERRLTFFFIPIWHWGGEYFCICQKCKSVFSIAKEKGEKHELSRMDQLTYWDLKVVKKGNLEKQCHHCHTQVQQDHQFCHHCGRRL